MSGEDRNNGGFSSSSSSSTMQFKKFVSEDEIAEKKRIRQEEWDKARKSDDPIEAPEEEYDPRSLYEKLEDQKQRKQEEFESQFKFGNQVRGLDEEEAKFLDFVSDQQEKVEKSRQTEEDEAINEYRNTVISQPATSSQSAAVKSSRSASQGPSTSKKSQMALLTGAVKRKSTTGSNEAEGKKTKSSAKSDDETDHQVEAPDSSTEVTSAPLTAAMPCVVMYSDSSDSNSSSSSSDIDTDLLRRPVHVQIVEEHHK